MVQSLGWEDPLEEEMATHSSIGLGRSPGGGNGNSLQYRKSHGQRSLAVYSPWGHKDMDTNERLNNSSNV